MFCHFITADFNGRLFVNIVEVHNFVCQLVFWTVKNQDENIHLVCWASIESMNYSMDFKAFSLGQSHKEPIPHDKPFPYSWKSTFHKND